MYHSRYGYVGIVRDNTMCFATESEYREYIAEIKNEEDDGYVRLAQGGDSSNSN